MEEAGPKSVVRSLRLLLALAEAPNGARLMDLAEQLKLPTATVHRLLQALMSEGFTFQDPCTRHYEVGPSVSRLIDASVTHEALRHSARPILEALCEDVGETVFLSVRSRDTILYVDSVMPSIAVRMSGSPGAHRPLHATSQGKAIMAFLPQQMRAELLDYLQLDSFTPNTIVDRAVLEQELAQVNENGYAIQDEELEEGIRSVAAPVLDPDRWPVGAVCIGAPAFRVERAELSGQLAKKTTAAANGIAARLFSASLASRAAASSG